MAEDDEDLLATLVAALEGWDFEVSQATNGVELLEHLADDAAYDLVVTDVSMPWASGMQVMTSTRYAGMLDVPVVVITALRSPELAEQVRKLGGRTTLLLKPFDLDTLHTTVRAALSGKIAATHAST